MFSLKMINVNVLKDILSAGVVPIKTFLVRQSIFVGVIGYC